MDIKAPRPGHARAAAHPGRGSVRPHDALAPMRQARSERVDDSGVDEAAAETPAAHEQRQLTTPACIACWSAW
jgi:hypothetical protein